MVRFCLAFVLLVGSFLSAVTPRVVTSQTMVRLLVDQQCVAASTVRMDSGDAAPPHVEGAGKLAPWQLFRLVGSDGSDPVYGGCVSLQLVDYSVDGYVRAGARVVLGFTSQMKRGKTEYRCELRRSDDTGDDVLQSFVVEAASDDKDAPDRTGQPIRPGDAIVLKGSNGNYCMLSGAGSSRMLVPAAKKASAAQPLLIEAVEKKRHDDCVAQTLERQCDRIAQEKNSTKRINGLLSTISLLPQAWAQDLENKLIGAVQGVARDSKKADALDLKNLRQALVGLLQVVDNYRDNDDKNYNALRAVIASLGEKISQANVQYGDIVTLRVVDGDEKLWVSDSGKQAWGQSLELLARAPVAGRALTASQLFIIKAGNGQTGAITQGSPVVLTALFAGLEQPRALGAGMAWWVREPGEEKKQAIKNKKAQDLWDIVIDDPAVAADQDGNQLFSFEPCQDDAALRGSARVATVVSGDKVRLLCRGCDRLVASNGSSIVHDNSYALGAINPDKEGSSLAQNTRFVVERVKDDVLQKEVSAVFNAALTHCQQPSDLTQRILLLGQLLRAWGFSPCMTDKMRNRVAQELVSLSKRVMGDATTRGLMQELLNAALQAVWSDSDRVLLTTALTDVRAHDVKPLSFDERLSAVAGLPAGQQVDAYKALLNEPGRSAGEKRRIRNEAKKAQARMLKLAQALGEV